MNRTPVILASGLVLGAFASLAAPAEAQTLLAQGVLQEDAAEATASSTSSAFQQAFSADAVVQADPRHFEAMDWSNAQAQDLLRVIRGIDAEGLVPADYLPDELAAALSANDAQQIDELASTAFAWLVEDLRDGRTPMENRRQWFVVDPDAERSPTAVVMAGALETGDIAGALDALKPTHPDYAALRDRLARTPATATAERRLIRANMDRWRWLARDLGGQYLITNVPEYQLRLTVNNQIIRTYRTVVGKPGRTATPQLAETVEGVVFNPTWTVPQSIVVGEGLGQRALNNPSWAARQGYRATRGANGFITVVQQPGPTNSLGVMKLDMPNPHAIFFHDTPSRDLFSQDDRALSHGCIRTERALELAMTIAILGQGATRDEVVEISTSGEYTRVPVKKTMPAYITYFTYGVDIDGNLRRFDDIYERDAPVFASLDAPRVRDRARVSSEEVIEIVDDPRDTL